MSLHLTEEEYKALQERRRNEKTTVKPRTKGSFSSMRNNEASKRLEGRIQAACGYYRDQGRAYVEKIPEPFRTMHTYRDGTFSGRFIANAQPDFMGIPLILSFPIRSASSSPSASEDSGLVGSSNKNQFPCSAPQQSQ